MDSTALTNSLPEFTILSMCSKQIAVKTAIEVKVGYRLGGSGCTVFLVAEDEDSGLQAFFVYYNRRYDKRVRSSSCSRGAIYLYNFQNRNLLGDAGYCRFNRPDGYHALGANGSIHFTKGFFNSNLKFTIRIVQNLFKNETCPNGTLDCGPDDSCIANSLECDSIRDCPSGFDERDHCPAVPSNYLRDLYKICVPLLLVITGCFCLFAPARGKAKPKNVYVPPEGGTLDGNHTSDFGTTQLGYVTSQAPPDGNQMQGSVVPTGNPPVGTAQPADTGPQTSYAGVQAPQTSYAGVQAPQTSYAGVQTPQTSYAGVQTPQTSYAGVQAPQTSYAGVQAPQTSYAGIPARLSPSITQ